MKEVFVNHSLNYLKNNNVCNSKQEKVFRYTLETLYSFAIKSFVIILLSIFFNNLKNTFLTLLLYSIMRGFSFGIHANKNIYCWIISLSIYIICPLFVKYISFPLWLIYLLFICGLISLILWSPADTKSRPLLNKRKRIINKYISICITSFYIILTFIIKDYNFSEIVAIVLLINLICICPLTYYIFNQTYKNYRFYKNN